MNSSAPIIPAKAGIHMPPAIAGPAPATFQGGMTHGFFPRCITSRVFGILHVKSPINLPRERTRHIAECEID